MKYSFSTQELFDRLSSFGFTRYNDSYLSFCNENDNYQFRYYPDSSLLQLNIYNKNNFIPIIAMPKGGWAGFILSLIKREDEWKDYKSVEFDQQSLTLEMES